MTTIKDIAKIAGVSHGTVSNVLNGRGNVSVKKIKLVEEAAQKLGYQSNLSAKVLKEGVTKTISVILPNITSEQYNGLYEGIFNELSALNYELALYITHDSPVREHQLLQKIATKRDAAIIVVSCLASAEVYYQTVKTPKHSIIFVYRKPLLAEQFLTLDFEQAGKDIAAAIMTKGYHRIGLFTNSTRNTHAYCLKSGLLAYFEQSHYPIQLQHVESIPSEGSYNQAFAFFNEAAANCDVIITSDSDRARYVQNASYLGSNTHCPPIYTLTSDLFFYQDNCYQYHMNYAMLSQKIVSIITGKEVCEIVNKGFLFAANRLAKPAKSASDKVINLLILPSPTTDAVSKLLPHFFKTTGIRVNLLVKSFAEIYRQFTELNKHPEIDIVRIDIASLPWFAHSLLRPLTELKLDLNELLSQYSQQVVERFSYSHATVYALPFDPSIQMLFYRQDLFVDPLVKRQYFEQYRQNLAVPENFGQFNQICEFFNQHLNPDSPIKFGSTVTLGNHEIIASEFLLRYYANGGKLIDGTIVALDKPLTQLTLAEFAAWLPLANNLDVAWWRKSVELFEQGESAMLLVYANLFSHISNKNILPLINCAPVPGNHPLLGGGSLGMSRYSNKTEEVAQFFNWIVSKEISEQIALLGGSVASNSVLQNQKIINHYPWFNLIQKNYLHGVRENQLADGRAINLRQIERIIGEHIALWLTHQNASDVMIDHLNQALKQIAIK